MSDDAYITLRTVDHFVNGRGLTWNPDERVQAYTHPLWMFLLSGFYFFTRAPYITPLILSLLISVATVVIIVFIAARSVLGAFFAILALTLSKSFVDYSTSGLENPLTHLIIVCFFISYFRLPASPKSLFYLSLLAALGILNRMDTALLFAPALLYRLIQTPTPRALGALILGQLPFLLWEIFSLFYYGFPFPNTAYAKIVGGDFERLTLIQQGLYYVLNAINLDPLTILVILSGIVLAISARDRPGLFCTAGILLYLAYVIYIGGDFMSGRFFTAPLVAIVVCIVARYDFDQLQPLSAACLFLAVLVVGFGTVSSTLWSNADYGYTVNNLDKSIDNKGIADERAAYYSHTGLLRQNRDEGVPSDLWWELQGRPLRSNPSPVIVTRHVGFIGYYADPNVHIVDEFALTDPLLARLPPVRLVRWRMGHWLREVPKGYLETLASGKNQIEDKDLAAYYDQLALITRGNLFSLQRLKAIWDINLGRYDGLVNFNAYRYPAMFHLSAAQVSSDPNRPANIELNDNGLEIALETTSTARQIEISLEPTNDYRLVYLRDDQKIALEKIPARFTNQTLVTHLLAIPRTARTQGFNKLWLLPDTSRGQWVVGHVRLLE